MFATILLAHASLGPLMAPVTPVRIGRSVQSVVQPVPVPAQFLRRSADVRSIPRAARGATSVVEVDRAGLERFAALGGGALHGVPLGPGVEVTLALSPIEPFAADAVLEYRNKPERIGARVETLQRPLRTRGVFLHGAVVGAPESRAFLAVSDAGTFGFVEWNGSTYIISSGPTGWNSVVIGGGGGTGRGSGPKSLPARSWMISDTDSVLMIQPTPCLRLIIGAIAT